MFDFGSKSQFFVSKQNQKNVADWRSVYFRAVDICSLNEDISLLMSPTLCLSPSLCVPTRNVSSQLTSADRDQKFSSSEFSQSNFFSHLSWSFRWNSDLSNLAAEDLRFWISGWETRAGTYQGSVAKIQKLEGLGSYACTRRIKFQGLSLNDIAQRFGFECLDSKLTISNNFLHLLFRVR